jgi:putative transposase
VRGLGERFVRRVLPLFQRRTREVGELLPQLYLHGRALGAFDLALRSLLGDAAPLSPASLGRLKAQWQHEYAAWKQRRLEDREVVSVGADGLEVKAGLEDTKAALLVMIGALTDGRKVVLAVESGQRESQEAWGVVLRALRARGLRPWRCTVAEGHLGSWAALGEQQPTAAEPRCWNQRLTKVLGAIPPKYQAAARTLLGALPYADTPAACEPLWAQFDRRYRPLAPNAMERLEHEGERLITFSQVRREHGRHLRTTNVVESPVAAVRLRTTAAKRLRRWTQRPRGSGKCSRSRSRSAGGSMPRRYYRRYMPGQHTWMASNSALATTRRWPPDPIYTRIDKTSYSPDKGARLLRMSCIGLKGRSSYRLLRGRIW